MVSKHQKNRRMSTVENLDAAADKAARDAKQNQEVYKVLTWAKSGLEGNDENIVGLKGRVDAFKDDANAAYAEQASYVSLVKSSADASELGMEGVRILGVYTKLVSDAKDLLRDAIAQIEDVNVRAAVSEGRQKLNEVDRKLLFDLYMAMRKDGAKRNEMMKKTFGTILGCEGQDDDGEGESNSREDDLFIRRAFNSSANKKKRSIAAISDSTSLLSPPASVSVAASVRSSVSVVAATEEEEEEEEQGDDGAENRSTCTNSSPQPPSPPPSIGRASFGTHITTHLPAKRVKCKSDRMNLFIDGAKKDGGLDMLCVFLTHQGCNPFDTKDGALAFRLQFTKVLQNSGAIELQHAKVVQKFFAYCLGTALEKPMGNPTKELHVKLATELTNRFRNKVKYALSKPDSHLCTSLVEWKDQTQYNEL